MSKLTSLLTTAAAAALVGVTASGAMAFDEVNWDWTASIGLDITVTGDFTLTEFPSLTKVQKLQVKVGEVVAEADVGDIDNADIDGVINEAIAVGNNQNIEVDTALLLHDAQIAIGAFSGDTPAIDLGDLVAGLSMIGESANPHTSLALATLAGAAFGYITPATISATANTDDVAIVDGDITNTAVAVANNANWSVASDVLIADLTQVAIANVTANATANVLNLGGTLTNTATAVGNNLKITVGDIAP